MSRCLAPDSDPPFGGWFASCPKSSIGEVPRKPRINAPGLIHHVTVLASAGDVLFADDVDRWRHIALLSDVIRETDLRCLAFCQMTTHAHLLVQERDVPLARCMHLLNSRYSRHVNARRGRIGHVQATRYGDNLVGDDAYLRSALKYIWQNPCEAGMCEHPEDWRWSSYRACIGLARPWSFVDSAWLLAQFAPRRDEAIRIVRGFVEQVPGTGTRPGARHLD